MRTVLGTVERLTALLQDRLGILDDERAHVVALLAIYGARSAVVVRDDAAIRKDAGADRDGRLSGRLAPHTTPTVTDPRFRLESDSPARVPVSTALANVASRATTADELAAEVDARLAAAEDAP